MSDDEEGELPEREVVADVADDLAALLERQRDLREFAGAEGLPVLAQLLDVQIHQNEGALEDLRGYAEGEDAAADADPSETDGGTAHRGGDDG